MIFLIITAYVALGAFIAGLFRAKDAPMAVAITLLYPFIPMMMFGAWMRELIHAIGRHD